MQVALVTQNADLELDLRPRAEAEALSRVGFDVTLVGGTRNPARLREITPAEVRIAWYPMPDEAGSAVGQMREQAVAFTRTARTLIRLARRTGVDVIHASNPPDNAWLLIPLLRGVQGRAPRFVFDQHDVAPVLIAEKYGSAFPMRALAAAARSLERRSFVAADLVVFANAEYERRAADEGLLRSDCVVAPNGWSLPDAPTRSDWRDGATHLIAYVGAINEQDCLDHLVEAIALLPERDDVRVCVAGDGAARLPAERLTHELGIAGSFRWLGWVRDRREIASLVRSADVCVAPELDSPFNRLASFVKLVEYMSAGAATVAHRLAQNERLCADTVAYADDMSDVGLALAISRVLADRGQAEELGAAARERFQSRLQWSTAGEPALVAAYTGAFRGSVHSRDHLALNGAGQAVA